MERRDFIKTNLALSAVLAARPLLTSLEAARTTPALGADLAANGDLRLPAWGPYTKTFAGISHVPAIERGLRFDLSVFPGLYRRRQPVPAVTADTGFYAWSATPGLETYTLRHVLGELETFYADLTYSAHGEGRLIEARFVNRTPLPQQASLHYLASINFPERGPGRLPALRAADVALPAGAAWIDGSHYSKLALDDDSPLRHLPDNAEIWGEVRADGFIHGIALGRGFGTRPGHRVEYVLPENFDPTGTLALVRFRLARGARVTLRASGAYAGALALEGTGDFQLAEFARDAADGSSFRLEPTGGAEIEIDGCALVRAEQKAAVSFSMPPLDYRPTIQRRGEASSLVLKYAAVDGCYGLAWAADDSEVREWLTDQLERDFPLNTHEHVRRVLDLGGQQHFTNVFVRPIFLAPGETKELRAFVCHGHTAESVASVLEKFHADRPTRVSSPVSSPTGDALPPHVPAGRAYAYGIERLAATLATNVVYPVRRRGRFIRHYTPGRWWDSLYTWDSGFIGLGLLELEPARAIDNLETYLTSSTEDCAFIHHGSPVPVQIYLLQALWNRTHDSAMLRRFFPGARRMHRFLVGRGDGSHTRTLASGLIRTWDYFYNSGGWDDYPPQKFIRGTKLAAHIAPVVNSAHAIRTARLLREMAVAAGEATEEFDADIAGLSDALQLHAWNSASGWFSYVRHDEAGRAIGPLLHESGADFNRGLDGIYPLVAGICTPAQEKMFVTRLRDESVFWTRCGLTTVDRSAPYYRADGYWNGAVWMPHQWFFWKTLLDLGEGDLAWQIAHTALQTWEAEVRATGCSFEHFIVATGRGAGWHQFGGLSSPLLSWFSAYHRPGSIHGGFDCWVSDHSFANGMLRARLRLTGHPAKTPTVLAVVSGSGTPTARWNGNPIAAKFRHAGLLEITLPSGTGDGELLVE